MSLNIHAINDLLEAEIKKLDRRHLDLLRWMLENYPEIYEEYELSRENRTEASGEGVKCKV